MNHKIRINYRHAGSTYVEYVECIVIGHGSGGMSTALDVAFESLPEKVDSDCTIVGANCTVLESDSDTTSVIWV